MKRPIGTVSIWLWPVSVFVSREFEGLVLCEAQIVIESWRKHYNDKRPHNALGYRRPAPENIISMRLLLRRNKTLLINFFPFSIVLINLYKRR